MLDKKKFQKEGGRSGKDSIPVIVDNIINLPSFDMVRFIYFSVDSADNETSYSLKARNRSVPVWIVSFQGIIHAPVRGSFFSRPAAIERLFDTIEESGDFFVDTNDLMLPISLFDLNPKRGEVYRVTRELFSQALKFRNDRMEYNEFSQAVTNLKGHLLFSDKETLAFQKWSQSTIQEAKKIYPKNEGLRLQYV